MTKRGPTCDDRFEQDPLGVKGHPKLDRLVALVVLCIKRPAHKEGQDAVRHQSSSSVFRTSCSTHVHLPKLAVRATERLLLVCCLCEATDLIPLRLARLLLLLLQRLLLLM